MALREVYGALKVRIVIPFLCLPTSIVLLQTWQPLLLRAQQWIAEPECDLRARLAEF